ncbi:MAG: hypothetical protein ABI114_12455, partial [Rhodanobacter sp.]
MLDEFYITCALPHSLARNANFHVSLFFSPTIRPPAPTTLAASSLFQDWATAMRTNPRIRLFDQSGDIPCKPVLDAVNPELWQAMFPPTTPVAANEVPRWEQRKWRSFSARNVHDIARVMHLTTMFSTPTDKPLPDEHFLAPEMARRTGMGRYSNTGASMSGMPDERALTAAYDKIIEGSKSLAGLEKAMDGNNDPIERILLELHRCRRFYERPELQAGYRSQPDPKAKLPPLEKSAGEFHERCALLGDHSELLRRLGLVVDLRVTDPARLRKSRWLSAQVLVGKRQDACRSPRVRCHVAGDALVSTPAGADWVDGALRLGDEKRFSVLTLDTDGSALKMERFLWTLPRLLRSQRNGDPVDAASPALRSTGFTVAATSQGQQTQDQLARQRRLETSFIGNTATELFTEDIARGFRIEVWDDQVKRWASLHKRLSSTSVIGFGDVYSSLLEEGFSQGTAAHESPRVDNSPVHIHEALFGWEGWSLSAVRPGKLIVHDNGTERLQEAPSAADAELAHPIRVATQVAPGTLPRLRFGRRYAFRAWAVDLAGNSRVHSVQPNSPAPITTVTALLATPPAASVVDPSAWIGAGLRPSMLDTFERRDVDVTQVKPTSEQKLAAAAVLGDPLLGPALVGKLRTLHGRSAQTSAQPAQAQVQRRKLVSEALTQMLRAETQPFARNAAAHAPSDLAEAVSAQIGAALRPALGRDALADAIKWGKQTVTALHPFLRWEPISSPVLVPRTRYTEGESLRELVVRSGVVQDPGTLELSVIAPADYAT